MLKYKLANRQLKMLEKQQDQHRFHHEPPARRVSMPGHPVYGKSPAVSSPLPRVATASAMIPAETPSKNEVVQVPRQSLIFYPHHQQQMAPSLDRAAAVRYPMIHHHHVHHVHHNNGMFMTANQPAVVSPIAQVETADRQDGNIQRNVFSHSRAPITLAEFKTPLPHPQGVESDSSLCPPNLYSTASMAAANVLASLRSSIVSLDDSSHDATSISGSEREDDSTAADPDSPASTVAAADHDDDWHPSEEEDCPPSPPANGSIKKRTIFCDTSQRQLKKRRLTAVNNKGRAIKALKFVNNDDDDEDEIPMQRFKAPLKWDESERACTPSPATAALETMPSLSARAVSHPAASASLPGMGMRLAMPEDDDELNSLHCFVRSKLLEVFVLDKGKCPPKRGRRSEKSCSRNHTQFPRVAIRCVHCAHLSKKDRGAGNSMATFFPKSVEDLYRQVCTWQRIHFRICTRMPQHVCDTYWRLKEADRTRGRKAYWIKSALQLGLRNADENRTGVVWNPEGDYSHSNGSANEQDESEEADEM